MGSWDSSHRQPRRGSNPQGPPAWPGRVWRRAPPRPPALRTSHPGGAHAFRAPLATLVGSVLAAGSLRPLASRTSGIDRGDEWSPRNQPFRSPPFPSDGGNVRCAFHPAGKHPHEGRKSHGVGVALGEGQWCSGRRRPCLGRPASDAPASGLISMASGAWTGCICRDAALARDALSGEASSAAVLPRIAATASRRPWNPLGCAGDVQAQGGLLKQGKARHCASTPLTLGCLRSVGPPCDG